MSHYQKFDIPQSWQWVKLECIGEVITGSTPSKDHNEYYGGDYPFFKPSDLEQGLFTLTASDHLTQKGFEQARQLPKDSILVTCIGATIGKTGRILTEGSCNQQINAVVLHKDIAPEYFYYVCLSDYFQTEIKRKASATTLPILNKNNFSALELPLPPIREQIRILETFSKIFSYLDKIEDYKSTLTSIISSAKSKILELAMQGKLVQQDPADEPAAEMLLRINPKARIITDNPHSWNIPKSWCWCQIGDLFHHNTGKALNSSNKEGDEYEYITTSNVYWDRFELDSLKRMLYKDSEIDKCKVVKGDLLVCEGGDVGRSAIWNMDFPIMIQNHLHRLRPVSEQIFPPLYLHVFKLYKDKDLIGGKGIALQGFSSNALHQLVVPCVPYNEQKRIVAKIEELYAVLDEIEASLQS